MSVTYTVVVEHHDDGLIDMTIHDIDHDVQSQLAVAVALRHLATQLENGGFTPATIQ